MYQCYTCKKYKDISCFYKDGTRSRGFRETCKECCNKIRKPYFEARNFPITKNPIKLCTGCKLEKPITEFHRNKKSSDGLVSKCKDCRKDELGVYYINNKDKKIIQSATYYKNNKETLKPKRRIYQKNRLTTDPLFLLTRRLRNRLYYALESRNWKKNTKFSKYIGCTLQELKSHIEQQFKPGMTWENRTEWHIDHIIPLAIATSEDEIYKLCHYTNLQPLWAAINLKKSNKV